MEKQNNEKYNSISIIISVLVCTALYAIVAKFFTFFYDLNDDALIASILSGSYTGTPDAHCIQMLYPVSWVLKTLYTLNPKFPWMGVFEIVLSWLCLVLIFARTQTLLMQHIKRKPLRIASTIGLYIAVVAVCAGCFFWEMVMLQYTVICGMLAATAAYLVLTCEDFEITDNITPICFVILAFNIRTEMLLLMSPFLAVVGICKWIPEGISVKTTKKYMSFLGIIIAGMAISYGINAYAYSSPKWQEFDRLFDARTEVYDFTGIPDYDENESFYESKIVYRDDYDRLVDYNYVLSNRVDADLLEDIAEYATDNSTYKRSLPYAIFENVKNMANWKTPWGRSKYTDDTSAFYEDGQKINVPFNTIIIVLYGLLVICAVFTKNIRFAYSLPICFVMRFISWGYIVYRGRVNARIAHPLYLIEMLILAGMLLMAWCESDYNSPFERKVTATILALGLAVGTLIAVTYIPSAINEDIITKTNIRKTNNVMQTEMYAYTVQHPRNYFLIDVYSSVNFTEELFTESYSGKANTQLAGGWAAKSPLDDEKQSHYQDKSEWRFISQDDLSDKWTVVDEISSGDETMTLYVYSMSKE